LHDLVGGATSGNDDRSMYDGFKAHIESILAFSMGKTVGANTGNSL